MKPKYVLYAVLGAAGLFAAVMGYLLYFGDGVRGSSALEGTERTSVALRDGGRTHSGKPGRIAIAYTGDITGNFGPCG
jgi:hypothetical protein